MKLINNTNNNSIIEQLKANSNINYELDIFVAYISIKGLYTIISELDSMYKCINIFVGKRGLESTKILFNEKKIDISKAYQYTEKSSNNVNINDNLENVFYEKLVNEKIESSKINVFSMIHKSDHLPIDKKTDMFHGKVYMSTIGDDIKNMIVGSHNLTFNALISEIENGDFKANEISVDISNEIENSNFLIDIKNNESEFYTLKTINDISELLDMNEILNGNYFHNLASMIHADKIKHYSESNFNDFEKVKLRIPFWDILAEHQKNAVKIIFNNIQNHGGSFLSLPTGMGKTWVSLTILYIFNVVNRSNNGSIIFVPNDKLRIQWATDWNKLTSFITDKRKSDSTRASLNIDSIVQSYNSKEFSEGANESDRQKIIDKIISASLIIIEESHNLRNVSNIPNRKSTLEILIGMIKQSRYEDEDHPAVLLVTATPINNSLRDLSNQIKTFPSRYKNSEVKENIISTISELWKVFEEKKKWYENTKDKDEKFNIEKSQKILDDQWSEIVNESFSNNPTYDEYTSFLNTFIYKGKVNELIDEKFDPTTDRNISDNKDKHVVEGNYKLENSKVEEILDIFEEYRKDKNIKHGLFGSAPNADSLFTMIFFKELESSPIASIKLMESFKERWQNSMDDPSVLEKNIDDQLESEKRRQSYTITNSNPDDIELEDSLTALYSDEDLTEKREKKISDKKDWLENSFSSPNNQNIYNKIISILETMIIDIENIEIINEEFFNLNPQFEKEKMLYFDLKSQELNKQKYLGIYGKTIVFAHYKATADYLTKIIRKFDFVIEFANKMKTDVNKIAFNASGEAETSQSRIREFVDNFSPLSRNMERVKKYQNNMNDSEWLDSFENETLQTSIMIATDSWAEGHNLQDATMLISYDTHWNPMRVVQRVGRIIRILTKEIKHHIYERLDSKKKIRYYWQKPNDRVIKNHIDLNRIISFKMMQIISSGFKYPISFNELLSDDDKRVKRIREIISEQTRGGSEEDFAFAGEEQISKFLGMTHANYSELKHNLDYKVINEFNKRMKDVYNGTVVLSGDENVINSSDEIILYFIIEIDSQFLTVPIIKNENSYSSIDTKYIDTDIYGNGNILATIYEETKDAKIINNDKLKFLKDDEIEIKNKIIETISISNPNARILKETIKYYSIFIKRKEKYEPN